MSDDDYKYIALLATVIVIAQGIFTFVLGLLIYVLVCGGSCP